MVNLTDEEFVNQLDNTRQYSPVIEELCKRLENKIEGAAPDANTRVECPVCKAKLTADYDVNNTMFTIKIDREHDC